MLEVCLICVGFGLGRGEPKSEVDGEGKGAERRDVAMGVSWRTTMRVR